MSLPAQKLKKQKEYLGTVEARDEYGTWPVKIELLGDQFIISGRYSRLDTYLFETDQGYLVAVTNYNRCGHVPADCTAYDVMDYVGIENQVDATTLAAAVRHLIAAGLTVSIYPLTEK